MIVSRIHVYLVETGSFRPVIAELETDEGISGIGEAALAFGVGGTAAAAMIRELGARFVLGRNPNEICSIWNDFYYDTFWGKGGGPVFFGAVSALECALWDIKGKSLNVPVYELLGGKQRDHIPCYANGWTKGSSPEKIAERAETNLANGFSAMKMYPLKLEDPLRGINGHHKHRRLSPEEEKLCVERVRAVREAIGPEPRLMLDFTAECTPDVSIRLVKALEEFEPYWIEEAVDPFDPLSFLAIRKQTGLTLAAGERVYTRYGFRPLIENGAVDVLQPDPGLAGGILETWRIASSAETHQMKIAPHNCGGPILTSVCLQLAACISNLEMQEVFPYLSDCHYDIVTNAWERQLQGGCLPVPDQPGIGVELNHKVVDPYRIYVVE